VVKLFGRVSHVTFHMQACQPITAEAGLHTADTPLQTERSKQRLKTG